MPCPYTEMSAWWWLLVTETFNKLYIIEYVVVFWLNNILVSITTQREGSHKKVPSTGNRNVFLEYPARSLVTTSTTVVLLPHEDKEYWNQTHLFPSHITARAQSISRLALLATRPLPRFRPQANCSDITVQSETKRSTKRKSLKACQYYTGVSGNNWSNRRAEHICNLSFYDARNKK
jgi:hypothetical protein